MTGFTTTEIDLAIKNLQATNQKISTINMRKILGRGSYGTIQKILRQKGYLDASDKFSLNETEETGTEHNSLVSQDPDTGELPTGSPGVESLISDAQKTLTRLRRENLKLNDEINRMETEVTAPLNEYQAILKFINNRFFQGASPEIPEDLLIILRELILRTRPKLGILHNDKPEYYRDDADRILRAILLSRNL
ncbi:MAG: DNA-binding protein [Ruminobacter sp.]|uniref:DNA-binding protein n=1 Tax=Ruminobacter sp. TaxID=2774296 RepID=UPI0025804B86|nr:DNA-binding protein [Ruminobacter sp.]MBQ3776249.1 DNA-binding protein [Ruminobacter sp.]